MSWEIRLLRVMSERQYHREFSDMTDKLGISDAGQDLLLLYSVYYERNSALQTIEYDDLLAWMHAFMTPKSLEAQEKHELRLALIERVFDDDITPEMVEDMRKQIAELSLAEEMADMATRYVDGNLSGNLMELVTERVSKYADMSRGTHLTPIRKDLGTILDEQDDENGLTFPLRDLNSTVAPLKAGDFVVVGAQNNTGKTAFAAQCCVHFAKQLPPDAKILYLNNEGIGDHILLRTRQIATGLNKYELEEAYRSGVDVEADYKEKINGDSFKIEVIDVHGINVSQVQSLLRIHKPDVVVYDMIDAVHGFGGGGMDVDRYKQLYSWARAQCANPEYRHVGIALTQVSHDGHDEEYVPKHALEGSKVAKQAQSDVLIMIGVKKNNSNLRCIWTPRCKRTRRGATEQNSKFIARFNGNVGVYEDSSQRYEPKPVETKLENNNADEASTQESS